MWFVFSYEYSVKLFINSSNDISYSKLRCLFTTIIDVSSIGCLDTTEKVWLGEWIYDTCYSGLIIVSWIDSIVHMIFVLYPLLSINVYCLLSSIIILIIHFLW